jgi:hypothetical protein
MLAIGYSLCRADYSAVPLTPERTMSGHTAAFQLQQMPNVAAMHQSVLLTTEA